MTNEVGINYTVADDGLTKYKSQRTKMEGYIQEAVRLQANHPDEWTGADELALQEIISDAKANLEKMDSNIEALRGYLENAKLGHKANETRNASLLAKAYTNATA